ncbi:MAG: UDP-glucose 4-epimerase [Candidatus Azotimanducaceae bacterium]|jgi:UDP-glucose 4-epimerase
MKRENMLSLVCGGAGFVGVNLVRELLKQGSVVCVDNLSLGSHANMAEFADDPKFSFIEHDLADTAGTRAIFEKLDADPADVDVWHLAANSDILAGVNDPEVDIKDTFQTTNSILAGMRAINAKRIYFASSSAIYGDMKGAPAREDSGPLFPISNYGAMKLASEALISAAQEAFLDTALLFRFPNVVGVPATHGVIYDFVRKLRDAPASLPVLGNGSQRKSYLHASDLVNAMIHLKSQLGAGVHAYNIGPVDEGIFVHQIAQAVADQVAPDAAIAFGEGNKGWSGDVPVFAYTVEKLLGAGWTPTLSSEQAMKRAVAEIAAQEIPAK